MGLDRGRRARDVGAALAQGHDGEVDRRSGAEPDAHPVRDEVGGLAAGSLLGGGVPSGSAIPSAWHEPPCARAMPPTGHRTARSGTVSSWQPLSRSHGRAA